MDQDLAKRVAYLEDRQAIQDLRHTYWLAITMRDLESLLGCYTADSHSEFGFGFDIRGAEATRAFYTKLFGNEDLKIQVPYGTNGLIKFVDETHADGSWLIQVVVINHSNSEKGVRNGVRYEEKYEKVGDQWKIAYQKTHYLYFEQMLLSESPLP